MSQKASDAVAFGAGLILVLAFFGQKYTSNGLFINFNGALTTSSPGELNFWLAQVLLLTPGMLLIGYGSGTHFISLLRRLAARVEAMSNAERYVGLAMLTLLAFSAARIARGFFLLDMPITDDELAAEFGGRVLASGHIYASLPLPPKMVPSLFLLVANGGFTSFDWPGGLLISAAATFTNLGPVLWNIVASIPVAAIAVAIGVRLGAAWGLAAALIFLCSPMAGLMSMTTHSQLGSRMFFSLALAAFSFAEKYDRPRHWVLTGAFIGLAFSCRPPETIFLAAPIVGWLSYRVLQQTPGSWPALGALVGGALPGLAILLLHSWATTGNPFLPARFASGLDIAAEYSLWTRFGNNFSYNLLMLAVWFLGPVGLVLAAVGTMVDRFTRIVGATVASALALAMIHDNAGLHIVGPIHYSECAVPLTLIAVFGLQRVIQGCSAHSLGRISGALLLAIGVGLPIFTAMQGSALRQQSLVQKFILTAIDKGVRPTGKERAVVLAPSYAVIAYAYPRFAQIGTWVKDWPRPQLDLSDEVLMLRDIPEDIPELRRQLPDRKFYRLVAIRESPYVVVVPLDKADPFPLIAGS